MALIKRADIETGGHRRVSLDLGDLARRAEMLRETAVSEAERIVAEAHAERARLLEGASEAGHAAGFRAGHAEGLAAGREEGHAQAVAESRARLVEFEGAWLEMIGSYEHQREALLIESRRAVIELAVAIAERVVHRKIELDPGVVENQLRDLLALVAAPTTLVVRVHPADEALVREVLPAIRERLVGGIHVRLVTDSAVTRGSCSARSLGGASIDATVATQLDRVVRDLLPGPTEAAP